MSSVEEICDNITLINKSRNILSGDVAELRHRFFADRYDLTFRGDSRALMEKMLPVAGEFNLLDPDPRGRQRLSLHVNPGVAVRDVIALANDTVELAAFSESLASMNDIFIRAVKEDEATR